MNEKVKKSRKLMTKRKILRQRREITRAYEIKRNALFYHSLDLGNSIRGRKK